MRSWCAQRSNLRATSSRLLGVHNIARTSRPGSSRTISLIVCMAKNSHAEQPSTWHASGTVETINAQGGVSVVQRTYTHTNNFWQLDIAKSIRIQ